MASQIEEATQKEMTLEYDSTHNVVETVEGQTYGKIDT